MGQYPAPAVVPSGTMRTVQQTPQAGFALTGGTPTILQYTVPNDGKQHTVAPSLMLRVTSALTGGAINVSYTINGTPTITPWIPAGSALGIAFNANPDQLQVDPGTTVFIQQGSAVTVGAAAAFASIAADG